MEQALVDVLNRNGLNTKDAPVFIESFWPSALITAAHDQPGEACLPGQQRAAT